MKDYGERTCMNCGKKFDATYLQQVTCSDACKKERMRIQHRESAKGRWPKHKAMIEELRNSLAVVSQDRDELKAQVEKLTHENKRLHEELSKALFDKLQASKVVVQPPKKSSKQWCERLKLKAEELPCGNRPECFVEPICDKAVRK